MKKLFRTILSLFFLLFSITAYGLPAQEMKNYAVLCDTFETLIIDNPKTHLKMDEFGLNAIAGVLISPSLISYCGWSGKINPEYVNWRYDSDKFEEELTVLRNEVYNTKYVTDDDKKRMLEKIADFYSKYTSGIKPSETGVLINKDNVEKLNSIYSLRKDFDYADDLDLGWNVEWGEKNDVRLHYEEYELVIPFKLGVEREKVQIDRDDIKLYIHEKDKPRKVLMGYKDLKIAEYLTYITGKVLELDMYVSQSNYHK